MSKLHDFWRTYPVYDVHSIDSVNNYRVFHPEDLAFLHDNFPHFFESVMSLKGRKLSERLKFEQHLRQLNGQYVYREKEGAVLHEDHINIWVPEPFTGNLEQAKALILLVNPHFTPKYHQDARFRAIFYNNLQKQRADFAPHEFKDGTVNFHNQLNWFYERFFSYIERAGHPIRQNDLMNIEFLPYASDSREGITYLNKLLLSQQVAMEEVKTAIRKGINIIVRSTDRSRWIQHVPELTHYKRLFVFTNFKKPSLHPNEVMRYETFKARDILKVTNRLKQVQHEDYQLFMDGFNSE